MALLYSCTLLVCAALLFLVQPMAGKALLPLAGGSPAVWTACMLFFQCVLLGGYALAHALSKLRPPAHAAAQCVLLVAAWLLASRVGMPGAAGASGEASAGAAPALWVLRTLTLWLGVPVLALATMSPTLQHWFGNKNPGKNPYALAVASNAGSLLGLLAYPFFVEPAFALDRQWWLWRAGLGAMAVLVVMCGVAACGKARSTGDGAASSIPAAAGASEPSRWRWVVLPMIASSLLLGVTQYISTDVAAVPLLWIVPLAIYLLTFIGAFATRRIAASSFWARAVPLAVLPLIVQALTGASKPTLVIVGLHLAAFGCCAALCHWLLADARPDKSRLTEYYLCMSIGGALGGVFNALLAPVLFDRVVEYPLMIALACAARTLTQPGSGQKRSWFWTGVRAVLWGSVAVSIMLLFAKVPAWTGRLTGWTVPGWLSRAVVAGVPAACFAVLLLGRRSGVRFASAVGAVLVGAMFLGSRGQTLRRERTFFGVHQVVYAGDLRYLYHGTTLHGVQSHAQAAEGAFGRATATTYYHRTGPAGDVVRALEEAGRLRRAALIGLGAGTMAAYAQPGMRWVFFEIDPAVVAIAQDPACFTFVNDARQRGADVTITLRDGRLGVAGLERGSQDLIVVDAFSSDSVPVHLLTREAIAAYMDRLAPGGLLAVHISSRTFDLKPVMRAAAEDLGLVIAVRQDDASNEPLVERESKFGSTWAVFARDVKDLGFMERNVAWEKGRPAGEKKLPPWTDDRSDVVSVIIWDGGF